MSVVFISAVSLAAPARAATLCVNTSGKQGCYTSISAAVSAASAGDTITVAQGTYSEQVTITKPLSLVGDNRENTIIAANGHSNGIHVDGFTAPGLAHVVITGFTVQDANFEGILIQNTSAATVSENIVRHNDQNLQIQNGACPGLPAFETNEGDDCGEGIHLMGVDHSTIADNIVEHNAGGILVSDETASNHDNVITRNFVHDNPYDCGITMASHAAYVQSGQPPLAFGIFHNTVSDNESRHNGFGSDQGGAGIGIFAPGPGNVNTMNSIVHNRAIDNALPGIAVHNHVQLTFPGHPPNPNANDNIIVGNYISGNAADGDLPTTVPTGISVLGTTPITGLVIADNTIENEGIDIATQTASIVEVHLNTLEGKKVGVANLNAGGQVNATQNWWGCPKGPGANGCATAVGNVVYTPWLTKPPANHGDDK
ncbi:MAG TPA: right-handed parallel beta-helix repeat-containing protein [Humisphaera sp.]|nr:right-handed parallel beta-helix repeat-containing protein [Humisphaera sp.]